MEHFEKALYSPDVYARLLGEALTQSAPIPHTQAEDAAYCIHIGASQADPEKSRKDAVLTSLLITSELADALKMVEAGNVNSARINGASWEEIGRALGISRQAAQQKYSH